MDHSTKDPGKKNFKIDDLSSFFEETIVQLNLENALHCAPIHNLYAILVQKTVADLKSIAKAFQIPRYSYLKKRGLIAAITEILTDEKCLESLLAYADENEYAFFECIIHEKGFNPQRFVLENYMAMKNLGLVELFYHEGSFIFVVPHEIRETFSKIDTPRFRARRECFVAVIDLAAAVTSFYGFLHVEAFQMLLIESSSYMIDLDEISKILTLNSNPEGRFLYIDDYIVHPWFASPDFMDDEDEEVSPIRATLIAYRYASSEYPRYLPPLQELLKYSYEYYAPDSIQLAHVKSFLQQVTEDETLSRFLSDMLQQACRHGAPAEYYLEILHQDGITLNEAQEGEFLGLVDELEKNTRQWLYNGHTHHEIEMWRKGVIAPVTNQKVGRNAPCPCGSGKKYKNCCGAVQE
jgi:hypothetical protein